jgi:hypothetical protein
MTTLRLVPALVLKGASGVEVTDMPANGCDTRVTVTGGPASTLSSTPKLKLCGPAPAGVGSPLR